MIQLGETEIRVLGVMIEKSLTQASGYPMTINAILLGANQLQNRDPVVEYSEAQVATALGDLIHRKLAAQAPPEPGARANRFVHRAVEEFHWDRREQAIMAELLLRGHQTAGELRSRASRMTLFADIAAVLTTLEELQRREPQFVEELSREPGRSTTRFRHLLSNDEAERSMESSAVSEQSAAQVLPSESSAMVIESSIRASPSAGNFDYEARFEGIERRLEAIERDMHRIRALIE
ncbi:MAG: DUF480 domain-containing protein [Planctomycetes bacterium]|nr:DUF480 domain-containing protein [Planctomycetota bacterium]MBI3835195.1 DUF480 domain-containing protein [Planctomycetota bacterium]